MLSSYLEIRYNEKYIKDAKYCLDSLKIGENPKYKKEYEIYYPLIGKYKEFNDLLLKFFNDELDYCKRNNWTLNEIGKKGIENRTKENSYYKECYVNRNKYPYKSIIYLDEVMEDWFEMLKNNDLKESTLQALIKRITPRKPTK